MTLNKDSVRLIKTISETLALVGKQYGVKLELVKFSKYVLEVRVSKDG